MSIKPQKETSIFSQSEPTGKDAIDTYFECITTCSIDDNECVTLCVEQLKAHK